MPMGLEFAIDELPSPIKTMSGSHVISSSSSAVEEATTTKQTNAEGAEEENCTTPRGEECKLRPALVCPPAPRKPRPAKRKAGPPPQGFYRGVPRDLTTVFVPLTANRPLISKRIRVG